MVSLFVDKRTAGLFPNIRSISAMIDGVNFETIFNTDETRECLMNDQEEELRAKSWYFHRVVPQMKHPAKHNEHSHFLNTTLNRTTSARWTTHRYRYQLLIEQVYNPIWMLMQLIRVIFLVVFVLLHLRFYLSTIHNPMKHDIRSSLMVFVYFQCCSRMQWNTIIIFSR